MSAVQMNVRLDSALKESGNAVLEQLNITPSQVVRAVWEYLTVQETLPEPIMCLIDTRPNASHSARNIEHPAGGSDLISAFYQRVGIREPEEPITGYDTLRELAAAEQLAGWGLA